MMTQSSAGALPRGRHTRTRLLAVVVQGLVAWQTRRRARRALAKLDDYLLRDIGLDPIAAAHELSKPFWRD